MYLTFNILFALFLIVFCCVTVVSTVYIALAATEYVEAKLVKRITHNE